MRLSIINFAGTARTDVAVGTVSDASIDCTTRPATPRSGSSVEALGAAKVGAGFTSACAGVDGVAATSRTIGCVCTGAAGAAGAAAGVEAPQLCVGRELVGCAIGAAGAAGATGAAGALAPGIEIFGGVTGLGVGGTPALGFAAAMPAVGLFLK